MQANFQDMADPAEQPEFVALHQSHGRILLDFSQQLIELEDIPSIAAAASQAACDLIPVAFGRLWLLEPSGQAFLIGGAAGWTAADHADAPQQNSGDTEPGFAARLGSPVILHDSRTENRFSLPQSYHTRGIATGISIPLCENGVAWGVLAAHHDQPRRWTTEDCELLQLLANLTAGAIRHQHQRERAELAAEQQARMIKELRLKSTALDATADMVVITDLHGQVEYVNPAFERHTGYTRAEVLGTRFCFMKSEAAAPDVYHDIWETLFAGQSWQGVVINDRKDGTDYLEEQTITPVVGDDGQIGHFVAVKRRIGLGKHGRR